MAYEEKDYLMLSGLQHFAFCRRQWALIHLEQQWAENRLTAEGEAQHKHAHDSSFKEKRKDVLIRRGMRIFSRSLGLTGQCDVVEFHKGEDGVPLHGHRGLWHAYLVEYKHGKEKDDLSDELQLCAQAMCLEEMLGDAIAKGALFYHKINRRREAEFTDELRQMVCEMVTEMHGYMKRSHTPQARLHKRCQSCSLKDVCLPKLAGQRSATQYMKEYLEDDGT